jgi:hypothetical protein
MRDRLEMISGIEEARVWTSGGIWDIAMGGREERGGGGEELG